MGTPPVSQALLHWTKFTSAAERRRTAPGRRWRSAFDAGDAGDEPPVGPGTGFDSHRLGVCAVVSMLPLREYLHGHGTTTLPSAIRRLLWGVRNTHPVGMFID